MAEDSDVSEEGRVLNLKTAASPNFNNVLRASWVTCPWQRESILPFGCCQRSTQHLQTIPDFKRARVLADVIA